MRQTVLMAATATFIFVVLSSTTDLANAEQIPLKTRDAIEGKCSDPGDLFGPPSSKGVHTCVKKDGCGIVWGGVTAEDKEACDTWPVSGTPPSRAPEDFKKKMADAAADKAAADKAAADKAAADKAAAAKAAAAKAAADKAAAAKAAADKAAADKAAADKAAAAKAAATVHECTGIKLTCGSWAAKDKNTCRTCQQALCKTENGKDVLAGNKSQTQCYDGHGPPPSDLK